MPHPVKPDVPKPATEAASPGTITVTAPHKETPWTPRRDDATPQLPDRDPERYELRREHGRGGLGRVLEVYDRDLDRIVAVKELLAPSNKTLARFVREARITAKLEHPGIVPVHDAGLWPDGMPFYAMKLVSGRPLRELIEDCATFEERLGLVPNVAAVADAVAYAHSKRIIHRDLKPSNVIVGDFGETVVIDWGLAKDLSCDEDDAPQAGPYRSSGDDAVTAYGEVIGTPAYMPPEQARGGIVDERSDVYALGAMLYHVLTGVAPFTSARIDHDTEETRNDQLRPVRLVEPRVPEDLAAVIGKAMADAPVERYANAQQFAEDLRRFLTGKLVGAYEYAWQERLRRWVSRYRLPVGVGVIAIIALAGTVAYSYRSVVSQRDKAAQEARRAELSRDELLLANAYAWMERDPTTAIAWLKEYPETGTDLRRLRQYYTDAANRGVAKHVFDHSEGRVMASAVSSDGRLAAAGGIGASIEVWNTETGELARHDIGADFVRSLGFTSDGKSVVAAGDGVVRLVDVRSGVVQVLGNHAVTTYLTLSSDATHAAASLAPGRIGIWNLDTRTLSEIPTTLVEVIDFDFVSNDTVIAISRSGEVRVITASGQELAFPGLDNGVTEVAVSASGRLVATGGKDRVVRVWDRGERTLIRSFEGHTAPVTYVALSPDERAVASAGEDGVVNVWSIEAGDEQRLLGHLGAITWIAFSPSGRWLASVDLSGEARLWDLSSGSHRVYRGHIGMIDTLKFDPSERWWITCGADEQWRVWNMPRESAWSRRAHRSEVYDLGVFEDGAAVVSGAAERELRLWSADGEPLAAIDAPELGRVLRVYPRPRDREVVILGTRALGLWQPVAGKVALLDQYDELQIAHLSPDGDHVLAGDYAAPGKLRWWDLAMREARTVGQIPAGVWDLRVLPDNRRAVVASREHEVTLWNLATGENTVVGQRSGPIKSMAICAESTWLTIAGMDGAVLACRLSSGTEAQCTSIEVGDPVRRTKCIGDTSSIALGTQNGSVEVLDLATGERRRLGALPHYAHIMSVSTDGRFVAAGSSNGPEVYVWDLRDGLSFVLKGHTGGLAALYFGPINDLLFSAGSDKSVRRWQLENALIPPPSFQESAKWAAELTSARVSPRNRAATPSNHHRNPEENLP